MTYAVAVRLQRGVVFAADTRTNAGIDNVSQFRKLHFWRRTGDRVLVLLTAGNLAISQSVISIINEQLSTEAPTDRPTLMNVSSMYRAARVVGDAVREVRAIDGPSRDASKTCSSRLPKKTALKIMSAPASNNSLRRHTISPDRRAQVW